MNPLEIVKRNALVRFLNAVLNIEMSDRPGTLRDFLLSDGDCPGQLRQVQVAFKEYLNPSNDPDPLLVPPPVEMSSAQPESQSTGGLPQDQSPEVSNEFGPGPNPPT